MPLRDEWAAQPWEKWYFFILSPLLKVLPWPSYPEALDKGSRVIVLSLFELSTFKILLWEKTLFFQKCRQFWALTQMGILLNCLVHLPTFFFFCSNVLVLENWFISGYIHYLGYTHYKPKKLEYFSNPKSYSLGLSDYFEWHLLYVTICGSSKHCS